MSPSRLYTPHDVVADFNYCAADGTIRDAATFKQRYLGIGDEYTRSMVVHDIRGREDEFELDRNGFKFVKLAIKERNMKDVDSITTEYYKEMEDVLKEVTGASTVHLFNHCIRAAYQTKKEGGDPRDMAFPELNGPSGHPHCDYCGVPELVEGIKAVVPLPDHLRKLFDTCSRFSFMGTWRPIKTLQRDPLCVVDATTVPDSDYQLKVRSSNGMKGGNYIMSHGSTEPQHKWYYMHAMEPHDLVVFKGYDTKQDQPGWRCPHNSFIIPNTDHLPPRESIECRALCFFD